MKRSDWINGKRNRLPQDVVEKGQLWKRRGGELARITGDKMETASGFWDCEWTNAIGETREDGVSEMGLMGNDWIRIE